MARKAKKSKSEEVKEEVKADTPPEEAVEKPKYKPERHPNGYWKKGFSGNPGGLMVSHNKNSKLKQFANAMLTQTFDVAHEILTNDFYALKPAERIKLIFELWNRAEGRVPTQLNIKQEATEVGQMNVLQITDELGKVEADLQKLGVVEGNDSSENIEG